MKAGSPTGARWVLQVGLAVARRPSLWLVAVRQVFVLAAPGWWRRAPFLPLPDPAYLRFRVETAYGAERDAPAVDDVLVYLRWCKGSGGYARRP